jgi:hypothetical protein
MNGTNTAPVRCKNKHVLHADCQTFNCCRKFEEPTSSTLWRNMDPSTAEVNRPQYQLPRCVCGPGLCVRDGEVNIHGRELIGRTISSSRRRKNRRSKLNCYRKTAEELIKQGSLKTNVAEHWKPLENLVDLISEISISERI